MPHWEYHGPWWITAQDDDANGTPRFIVCAAVQAADEAAARAVIDAAFDPGFALSEMSFVNERAGDWSPFGERFSPADWMKWPWPVEQG